MLVQFISVVWACLSGNFSPQVLAKSSHSLRYVTVGGKNSGKTKPVNETFKISITSNIDDQE